MAKKNKHRNHNGNGGNGNGQNSPKIVKESPNLFPKVEEAVLQASVSLGEDAPELPTASTPPLALVGPADVEALQGYLSQLQAFVKGVEDAGRKRDAARKKYENQQEEVAKIREELENGQKELARQQGELAERDKDVADRERDMEARELNARENFAKQNEEALAERREQIAKLDERRLQIGAELEEMRSQAMARLNEEQTKRREELRIWEEELNARLAESETKERKLGRDKSRLDTGWRELAEEKEQVRRELESESQAEIEKLQVKLSTLQGQRDRAYQELAARDTELAEFEDFNRALCGKKVDEFLEEFDHLKQERRDLKRQLETLGETDFAAENERLRIERDALREKVASLEMSSVQALAELYTSRVNVLDKERLEGEKRALVRHKELLTAHLKDLESRVTALTNAQHSARVFPQLAKLDSDPVCQAKFETKRVPNLKEFASEVRMRVAGAYDGIPLFYDVDDIRILIGGMAMSQLHILQGMSGTGKTSIVKALAKVVGGHCADIAVQAGWRDKFDLIGHYNSFEKKYYEKECLQAIYQAQTPNYADRINIVLLDEMNLSRPEQYFAEFLSALEKNDEKERLIELREEQLPETPVGLVDGRKVRVPKNVWFMGTANHDETTNEFALKTQDRAHIMELRKCPGFEVAPVEQACIYSYESLVKRFREAGSAHRQEVEEVLAKLHSPKCELTNTLRSVFDVTWGNRFANQARSFVPVVAAAGGSLGLAFDHLLATRVFSSGKVTGRYDIEPNHLTEVERALSAFWSDIGGKPTRSLELLENDKKRKGRRA